MKNVGFGRQQRSTIDNKDHSKLLCIYTAIPRFGEMKGETIFFYSILQTNAETPETDRLAKTLEKPSIHQGTNSISKNPRARSRKNIVVRMDKTKGVSSWEKKEFSYGKM